MGEYHNFHLMIRKLSLYILNYSLNSQTITDNGRGSWLHISLSYYPMAKLLKSFLHLCSPWLTHATQLHSPLRHRNCPYLAPQSPGAKSNGQSSVLVSPFLSSTPPRWWLTLNRSSLGFLETLLVIYLSHSLHLLWFAGFSSSQLVHVELVQGSILRPLLSLLSKFT